MARCLRDQLMSWAGWFPEPHLFTLELCGHPLLLLSKKTFGHSHKVAVRRLVLQICHQVMVMQGIPLCSEQLPDAKLWLLILHWGVNQFLSLQSSNSSIHLKSGRNKSFTRWFILWSTVITPQKQ